MTVSRWTFNIRLFYNKNQHSYLYSATHLYRSFCSIDKTCPEYLASEQ